METKEFAEAILYRLKNGETEEVIEALTYIVEEDAPDGVILLGSWFQKEKKVATEIARRHREKILQGASSE